MSEDQKLDRLDGLAVRKNMGGAISAKSSTELPAEWRMTTAGKMAVTKVAEEYSRIGRNAMIASIPMICRGIKKCPFKDSCTVEDTSEIVGSKCPLEIAELISLMDIYVNNFEAEREDGSLDVVKMGLIRELVDCDIQIRRAERRMSQEGDFLEEVNIGYNEASGETITQRQISKPVEYKDKMTEKKHRILGLLNSTPKDKAADDRVRMKAEAMAKAKGPVGKDFSSYTADLYATIQNNPALMDIIRANAIEMEISNEILEGEDA